jgi:Cobalt transport protein
MIPVRSSRRTAVLKVCYLIAVTGAVFALPAMPLTSPFVWPITSALLIIQVIILAAARVGIHHVLRPIWRLKWFFLFLLAMYAFLPPIEPSTAQRVLIGHVRGWTISVNLSGLQHASLMCLQMVTVLLATAVVRLTGTGRDLVEGLHAFRFPSLFVHALDRTLDLMGTGTRGRGAKELGGGRKQRTVSISMLKQLARADFSAFAESIRSNIGRAEAPEATPDPLSRDVTVVTGLALCMASLKMLKVLPGLPFASGHKTFLLFPLYVLASRLTHSRWGATSAGSIMGVIGLLQGDGRFGPLEIFKHIAPGVVIDLGEPVVRRLPLPLLGYSLLGLVAAIARTATEFMVVLLLGAREEIYLFPAVKLIPNLIAGGLSGFVTVFVLRVFAGFTQSLTPPETRISPSVVPAADETAGPPSSGRGGDSRCG